MAAFQTLSVIGGGAWGTALANLAAHRGVKTALWAREEEVARAVNDHHENATYLEGVPLHEALKATAVMVEAAEAEAFLFVVPVQHARAAIPALKAASQNSEAPIALCSKGIERETNLLMTEIFHEVWPEARLAVLSGPSFARDVAIGKPTAVTLACRDEALGQRWAQTIGAPHFRPYLSKDLIGAELGGAVKNVLAITKPVSCSRDIGRISIGSLSPDAA